MAYFPFQPGQQPMSSSLGVVIASNQSPVSVAGTVNIANIVPSSVQAQIVGDSNNGSADTSNRPVGVGGRYLAAPGSYADGNRATILMDINGRQVVNLSNTSIISVSQGSIATVIIGGSIAASFTPPANQSVSGTIIANQGTNPWIITGSVQASITPAANQSVSGSVNVSSIFSIPGIVSAVNSTTATLTNGAVFTGTSEEVKDFASININVFADQVSATDGLSLQQSSDGANWDISDTYTIPASVGKTISVQPAARFFRVVYTNGGTGQGAFRLQTIYHKVAAQASSQRPTDGYTNETDLIQLQGFGMVYNGSTWDRSRGNSSIGTLVSTGSSSVITTVSGTVNVSGSVVGFQGTTPWVIGSIVGTYAEDVPSSAADKGLFTLGIRNDTVASLVGSDLDYTGWATDSAGRHLIKPFAADESRLDSASSVVSTSVVGVFPSVIGLRNYITDIMIANTGAAATLITFKDGSTSILGYTIAPAGGGSNINGMAFPLRTAPGQDFVYQATTATSVLYATFKGYKAP